jgi:hypothetical protein
MYYDEYAKKWYIDYSEESDVERTRCNGNCENKELIGIDACCGCAG